MKQEPVYWTLEKRIIFRFSFVFFALHLIPLSAAYWSQLFSQSGLFFTIFNGINYFSSFLGDGQYYDARDFGLVAGLSALAAMVWTLVARQQTSHVELYHWTRIVLRYKLASVLVTYALIKIIPIQLPEPTLSDLNTEYGEFTPARIVELTVGIAKAHYQTAVGLTELLAVLLLFFRSTATLGAVVASGTILNVVLAAFAYHTGAEYYSLYLILIAVFLLAQDMPAMFRLLMEKPAAIVKDSFVTSNERVAKLRPAAKIAFVVFALVYTGAVYGFSERSFLLPASAGLKDAAGLYDVAEFRINEQALPYSNTDSLRWQDVVFEKWATLSIRTAQKAPVNHLPVPVTSSADAQRRWESSGSGGRHYYSYSIDEAQQVLHLQNKNSKDSAAFQLQYSRPDAETIILSGRTPVGDQIHAVLKKVDKQYLLIKGRRKPVTL